MPVVIPRLKRWDQAFDPGMNEETVARIMALEPWSSLEGRKADMVRRILRHDVRVLTRQRGEIVVRQGDYGNSAFGIMRGAVRVVVDPPSLSRREERKYEPQRRGLWGALSQLWANRRESEERPRPARELDDAERTAEEDDYVPIILQDVAAVLDRNLTARLEAGEIFGEIAALGRTPRTATVFADEDDTELLEMRWQGLRDLRKAFPRFKEYVDERFRRRALRQHLRATPIFAHVGDTRQIRSCLASGRIRELFTECLGFEAGGSERETLAVQGETLQLEILAMSRHRDASRRLAVYACDAGGSRVAATPEGRRRIIGELCGRGCQVVIVYRGIEQGVRIWQSVMAEPDVPVEATRPREVRETRRDPSALVRQLLHVIVLEEIGRGAEFLSYGDFAVHEQTTRPEDEPLIIAEGQYPNGVILLRAGFARISRRVGGENRTVSYLGLGRAYGFAEIAHNARWPQEPVTLQRTLSALGYVDIVTIPVPLIEQHVLPSLPDDELPPRVTPAEKTGLSPLRAMTRTGLDRSLVEFLVDHRFINGSASMLIDLDRCTRCDECVRACATAHDDNPRFVRHGPRHGSLMVTNACMHCADPICMIGCPTGAISREVEGQVVINDKTCIGCASCANNCPYDNIRMVAIRSPDGSFYVDARNQPHRKATKCDLCIDQLGGPACQRACPHDALRRVDLRDVGELTEWLGR